MESPLSRLLCLLGVHGPNWFGNSPVERSEMTAPFTRTCRFCGAEWEGNQVSTRYYRTIGNWRRVK